MIGLIGYRYNIKKQQKTQLHYYGWYGYKKNKMQINGLNKRSDQNTKNANETIFSRKDWHVMHTRQVENIWLVLISHFIYCIY
jgi:hypothetical protein